MNIPLLMIVAYLIGTSLISFFFSRRASKNTSEYFVAERSLTVVLSVSLLFSELVAGAGTIGNAATAFKEGLSSVWANWSMALGCILFVCSVVKFYRSAGVSRGVMSVPQAYHFMFDTRTRMALLLVVAFSYLMLYSSQAVAAVSIIAPVLGLQEYSGILVWAVTVLFIIVTISSGQRGIAWMNLVHTAAMFIGMGIVLIMALGQAGGFSGLAHSPNLTPNHFNVFYPSFSITIGYALGGAISLLASAIVANITFSAKTYRGSVISIILGGILVIPFALMPAILGLCAKAVMPGINPNSSLFSIANHMGSAFGGLVAMAILAAILSTAPCHLLIISTTMTKDFYKGLLRKDAGEKEQLVFSRIVVIIVGLLGSFLGLKATSILGQVLGAFQIRSVVGIVLLVSIVWKRVTPAAAFWSIVCGGIVAAVWHFAGSPYGLVPLWPAAAVCILILVPITLTSKEKVSEGYKRYLDAQKDMEAYETKLEASVKITGN